MPVAYASPQGSISARQSGLDFLPICLMGGLLSLPFQVVQISIAQPAHLWMLAALCYAILARYFELTAVEILAYLTFIYFASATTFLQSFPRVKELEQLLKFVFFYPGFYFVGRFFGSRLGGRSMPLGYWFLFLFLAFQFVVQAAAVPVIYQAIDFGQNALHGTFRERNWLAVYYFMFSYMLVLGSRWQWKFVPFFAVNALTTLLTGSKTAIIACGIVFMIQSRLPLVVKVVPILVGGMLYAIIFANDFSQDQLNVKLQEERGLAFQVSMELINENPIGYGLGFVEGYFSSTSIVPKGLGEGTNSVFCVPLDLWIIAGFAGAIFWGVYFLGIGTGAFLIMLPIGALSLLNPLHQSEIVYFFAGMLVSVARSRSQAARERRNRRSLPGSKWRLGISS